MRALVFRGPWDIGPETREDPEPREGEVLPRITATGIRGSDIHGFTGESGRRHAGQVMGHETVGRAIALGAGGDQRSGLAPGAVVAVDPVIGCGSCPSCGTGAEQSCPARRVIGVTADISAAFADLMTAPAGSVVPLSETTPEEYGALLEPNSTDQPPTSKEEPCSYCDSARTARSARRSAPMTAPSTTSPP